MWTTQKDLAGGIEMKSPMRMSWPKCYAVKRFVEQIEHVDGAFSADSGRKESKRERED